MQVSLGQNAEEEEEEEDGDTWRPKYYPLDVKDPLWPPGFSTNIEIKGTMGEPFSKELTITASSYPRHQYEDVLVKVGLLKYERFPPRKLPNPEVFGPIPRGWVLEPGEVGIGTMDPGENLTLNLSARINRVGRYFIIFTATGRVDGGGVEELLWDRLAIVLEPRSGDLGRTTLLWVVTFVLIGVCLSIYIIKRRRTP